MNRNEGHGMSDQSAQLPDSEPAPTPSEAAATVRPPLRSLWIGVVLVIVYWVFVEVLHAFEFSGSVRFVSRMIALLILMLSGLVLWLMQSQLRWRDRLLVICGVPALLFAASRLTDKSIDGLGLVLGGMPLILTLGLLWLIVTRGRRSAVRAGGVLGITAVILGAFTLLRWEGLDGRQRSQYTWRWSLTPEERFLATRPQSADPASRPARDVVAHAGDWTGFRGPDRDDVVHGLDVASWEQQSPDVVWRKPVGPGWSSFAVVDGLLFTQEQRGPDEVTVCYNVETGDEVWASNSPTRFDESLSGSGPRATPTFAGGRIYSYGANGHLTCLAASSGEVLWSQEVLTACGGKVPQWGLSVSPLVIDGLVIVFAGGTDGRGVLALDAVTGEERWKSPAGTETYSSPQVVELDGVRQLVIHDNAALRGISLADGQPLWERANDARMFLPMLQPHVVGERDLVVGWGDGIARLSVSHKDGAWTVDEQWRTIQFRPAFNDFHIFEDHIYGLDDGILCCLSLQDGKRVWKRGRYGAGQLLLLPDTRRLVVLTERGELAIVEATPQAYRELAMYPIIEGKTWNHAAYAHGRLFVRNAEEMASLQCTTSSAP